MPLLEEQMYCSQQIAVPAMFPFILKQYAKAAIRTQPYDLLRWSASYFTAMANGETPPVKYRIEFPAPETQSGLTPGYLRVLLKQLGISGQVPMHVLYDKWIGVCLNESCLREMLAIGGFNDMVDWLHFVAVAAAHLTDSLAMTMCLCCELLTDEPEGGSAMIPCETFLDIYSFLARLECGPPPSKISVETVDAPIGLEGTPPTSADYLINPNGSQRKVDERHGEQEEMGEREQEEETVYQEQDPEQMESPVVDDEIPTEADGTEENEPLAESEASEQPPAEDTPPSTAEEQKEQEGETDENVAENEAVNEVTADDHEAAKSEGDGSLAQTLSSDEFDSLDRLLMQPSVVEVEEVKEEEPEVEEVVEVQEVEVQTVPLSVHVPGIGGAVPSEQIERVEQYMRAWADRQEGMVMPRNIRHFLCPPLDSLKVPREFQVDSTQDVHDMSYLYPQRRPITCEDVHKEYD